MHRKIIFACLLFQLLAGTAFTQDFSPKHRIPYRCNELCSLTDKKINRWAKLQKKKYRDEFRFQMVRLRSFGDWLDKVADDVQKEFSECWNVAGIMPEMVNVMAEPFAVAGYPSNARFSGTTDAAGHIRVVYWNLASFGGTQNAIDLARWEMRNFYWLKTGHTDELGGRPACGH